MSNEPQDTPSENVAESTAMDDNLINEPDMSDGGEVSPENEQASVESAGEVDSISEVLQEEIAQLKEQILRAQADAQNARRRAEQDVEKARKFALEKFVNDLLPVADNLERAIAAGDKESESQKAVLEGVELTLKSLLDTLAKYQVEAINPEGEPFNPEEHQAMSMVPNPDVEPNTVLNVFQKGYRLNGRLVRPAMVVVSSAP